MEIKTQNAQQKNDNLRVKHFIGSKVINSFAHDLTIPFYHSVFHQPYRLLSVRVPFTILPLPSLGNWTNLWHVLNIYLYMFLNVENVYLDNINKYNNNTYSAISYYVSGLYEVLCEQFNPHNNPVSLGKRKPRKRK